MKTLKRLTPEFGPDTRFEVRPVPAPFRAAQADKLEQLKTELLAERLAETPGGAANSRLRRAANEAAALACLTPFPLLVFPVLFEEKAAAAKAYAERQERVHQLSCELLEV